MRSYECIEQPVIRTLIIFFLFLRVFRVCLWSVFLGYDLGFHIVIPDGPCLYPPLLGNKHFRAVDAECAGQIQVVNLIPADDHNIVIFLIANRFDVLDFPLVRILFEHIEAEVHCEVGSPVGEQVEVPFTGVGVVLDVDGRSSASV